MGFDTMIITDLAVAVIEETFRLPSFAHPRPRRRGESAGRLAGLTSKAYAEAGLLTASERGRLSTTSSVTVTARRAEPIR
jgi:hypothetical protein